MFKKTIYDATKVNFPLFPLLEHCLIYTCFYF